MRRFLPFFCLIVVLVVTYLVYQRGLYGPFLFDDGPNIVQNSKLAIHDLNLGTLKQAAYSGYSGPLLRPFSMMSFAVNYYATGLDPYYFKLTNLVIHLCNGGGAVHPDLVIAGLLPQALRARPVYCSRTMGQSGCRRCMVVASVQPD